MKIGLTFLLLIGFLAVRNADAFAETCVSASCHASLLKVAHPHQPAAAGECLSCHERRLAEHPVRNAKSFELNARKEELCYRCHAPFGDQQTIHSPVREGDCLSCHDPHGSGFFRLLKGAYPERLYAPYGEGAYALCLKCHQKYLLRFRDTTIYTDFRNGSLNLHFVHVVGNKGRTCRTCHQPHASDGPKLTSRAGVPFGDWKVRTRLELTPTGGSCAPGCHRPFRYDREKPENYPSDREARKEER